MKESNTNLIFLSVLHISSIKNDFGPSHVACCAWPHRMWVQSEWDPPYCRTPGPVGALLRLSLRTCGAELEPAEEEPPLLLLLLLMIVFLEVRGGSWSAWDQQSAGLSGR